MTDPTPTTDPPTHRGIDSVTAAIEVSYRNGNGEVGRRRLSTFTSCSNPGEAVGLATNSITMALKHAADTVVRDAKDKATFSTVSEVRVHIVVRYEDRAAGRAAVDTTWHASAADVSHDVLAMNSLEEAVQRAHESIRRRFKILP